MQVLMNIILVNIILVLQFLESIHRIYQTIPVNRSNRTHKKKKNTHVYGTHPVVSRRNRYEPWLLETPCWRLGSNGDVLVRQFILRTADNKRYTTLH